MTATTIEKHEPERTATNVLHEMRLVLISQEVHEFVMLDFIQAIPIHWYVIFARLSVPNVLTRLAPPATLEHLGSIIKCRGQLHSHVKMYEIRINTRILAQIYAGLVGSNELPEVAVVLAAVHHVLLQTPKWMRETVYEKIMHTW